MAGIHNLYVFPVYQTREQFKAATGKEAPTWNPSKPIKSWFDPSPPVSDADGDVRYLMLALGADGKTPAVKNGAPYLRMTRVAHLDAIAVNIPPKEFYDQRIQDPGALSPFASLEVPVPCRELLPDEELKFGWGGLVEVRKKNEVAPAPGAAPASDSELRQLLLTIDGKLDILLATSRS